jgi:hypothetical protein
MGGLHPRALKIVRGPFDVNPTRLFAPQLAFLYRTWGYDAGYLAPEHPSGRW